MFEFAMPWFFLLLPLPILTYWLSKAPKNTQLSGALKAPFIRHHNVQHTVNSGDKNNKISILYGIIWCLLIIASARPQWLGEPISLPAQGRDLMLAVDLSGSMKMDDMQINNQQVDRLKMIKFVMQDFINRRTGDRLGLILFADTAYLQTPLTRDRKTVAQMLDESVIGLVGDKTAIGDAIGLAAKRFANKDKSNRILILLTDGQNTSGNLQPEQALQLAQEQGIKIYTIGVGADEMLQRGFLGYRKINPSADLDETMLSTLAESTGGQYFRARDTQELSQIYHELDKLEPISEDALQMRPLTTLFYWPLALALVLSFIIALKPFYQNVLRQKNTVESNHG
ncbi:vWA domain-containing protein [Catenovulum sediminis]|uniref:vWA domain-containing protein n=1 Tax=Catenovulum sediminis TaxID=1740262 RepID=UPI00117C3D7E|nr:VWA domain-containing protein [Catenovulum sediminis]